MHLLLALFFMLSVNDPFLERVRQEYALIGTSQQRVDNVMGLCKGQNSSLAKAYAAAAEMASAQFLINPFSKLSAFRSGREKLDVLLRNPEHMEDPEMRFIRYSVQLKCPPVLGYTNALEQDRAYLLGELPGLKAKDPALFQYILGFMMMHAKLSETEKSKALGK